MDKLKFIAISGTTNVTQNLYVYEFDNDIIVIDCGVGFPEEAAYGIDLVIPDFSYLRENKNKVRAVFISHGHEDHYGALPFLAEELEVPIYATKLVAEFIKEKFEDYNMSYDRVNVIDPEREGVKIGNFFVDYFRVTHSVPDSVGFCITTPIGKMLHIPDYKFDWTPVDGRLFDIKKASLLAADGVLALASDCLGATTPGYTESELAIEARIAEILEEAKGQVFLTTISSNISRMQQAINASVQHGRKIAFAGRSIETKAKIAKVLGYLKYDEGWIVAADKLRRQEKVTFIISGCYGQVGSALYKVATSEHQFLKVHLDDIVVFSADPSPPGTEQSVNYVVDALTQKGAEIHYYDTQEDLHVSGHGSQKDMQMLMALVRPRFLIPIGGTIRHMRAYKKLAQNMGWRGDNVFELLGGETVEFSKDGASRGETVSVRDVLVDGLGVGDVGHMVLRDRKTLAKEGIVVAVVQLDKGLVVERPDIISRGFVFAKEQQELINRAGDEVKAQIKRHLRRGDARAAKEIIVDSLERFFYDQTGRRPMIIPVVVEV